MNKHILALVLLLIGSLAQAEDMLEDTDFGYAAPYVSKINLTGQSVVCGYTDTASEENRAIYVDNVCRYFGFRESLGHTCGWSPDQKTDQAVILTVHPKTGLPAKIRFIKDPRRNLGFYSSIKCR